MNALRRLSPVRATTPSLLDDLGQVVGSEAALALATAFAGKKLYVPATIGNEHPIARVIGPAAAALLAEHYHMTEITLPSTPAKRARIIALAAAGVRADDIPGEVLCSRSFVYKVLGREREARADRRQVEMFAFGD